jgi:hypothetical protein
VKDVASFAFDRRDDLDMGVYEFGHLLFQAKNLISLGRRCFPLPESGALRLIKERG